MKLTIFPEVPSKAVKEFCEDYGFHYMEEGNGWHWSFHIKPNVELAAFDYIFHTVYSSSLEFPIVRVFNRQCDLNERDVLRLALCPRGNNKDLTIISGGQSGADMGGLLAAKRMGLKCGGTAPLGFRTENGRNRNLQSFFGLEEGMTSSYLDRTILNVRNSDATVVFGDVTSAGSKQTIRAANQEGKFPCINPGQTDLAYLLYGTSLRTLNVAGNRESVNIGISYKVYTYLLKELEFYERLV